MEITLHQIHNEHCIQAIKEDNVLTLIKVRTFKNNSPVDTSTKTEGQVYDIIQDYPIMSCNSIRGCYTAIINGIINAVRQSIL